MAYWEIIKKEELPLAQQHLNNIEHLINPKNRFSYLTNITMQWNYMHE